MIIYNVTLKVEPEAVKDWMKWMKEIHLPEMMETGLFLKNNFCRLLEQNESEGSTFVVQYYCEKKEDYNEYLKVHAEKMRQKGLEKFGNKMAAFRTLMEII